jgi:hypothetical protein
MLRRIACVSASVLDMESEKTSLPAIIVKGTSAPSVCAMPTNAGQANNPHDHHDLDAPRAMAVFPVEGGPAKRIARPAIRPSWTILRIMPAALRALACPTIPCEFPRGSSRSSRPRPRMCECAPERGDERGLKFVVSSRRTYALHLGYVPQLGCPCGDLGRLYDAMDGQRGGWVVMSSVPLQFFFGKVSKDLDAPVCLT